MVTSIDGRTGKAIALDEEGWQKFRPQQMQEAWEPPLHLQCGKQCAVDDGLRSDWKTAGVAHPSLQTHTHK